MQIAPVPLSADNPALKAQHTAYLWTITLAAAMGGLLFGYDWVVIGGARQFYEAYFQLTSEQLIGWANSSALVGCFVGSFAAGYLGDRFGRRRVLLVSAILFAISSGLTRQPESVCDCCRHPVGADCELADRPANSRAYKSHCVPADLERAVWMALDVLRRCGAGGCIYGYVALYSRKSSLAADKGPR